MSLDKAFEISDIRVYTIDEEGDGLSRKQLHHCQHIRPLWWSHNILIRTKVTGN